MVVRLGVRGLGLGWCGLEGDVGSMSFWFPRITDVSIPSRSVVLGDEFADYLYDVFVSAEDDVNAPRRVLRDFPSLAKALRGVVSDWGGVFVRGDRGSCKDACVALHSVFKYVDGLIYLPFTQLNACFARTPEHAVLLMINSERLVMEGNPATIWLRRPANLRHEGRVFVYGGVPRLITWYYPEVPVRWCPYVDDGVLSGVRRLVSHVVSRLGEVDLTVDVGFVGGDLVVVEVDRFPDRRSPYLVDTILFRDDFWEVLEDAVDGGKVVVRYPRKEEFKVETVEVS